MLSSCTGNRTAVWQAVSGRTCLRVGQLALDHFKVSGMSAWFRSGASGVALVIWRYIARARRLSRLGIGCA
jgi:hypothetical protein